MDVADRKLDFNRRERLQRSAHLSQNAMIERLVQSMILRMHASPRHPRGHRRIVENRGKVEPLRLPVIDCIFGVEHVDAPDHLVHRAESHLGHVLPNLLRDEEKEIDHVLRLALEALAQLGILRRNAHRAGIQVALAHHDAAHGDQRRRGETEFFGAEQRGDHHIAPGLQFAVGLHANTAAQIVEQQNLLRLRQPEFPGNAGVLDGTQRRCARAAAVAADQHDIGMRFGDAGGDRAHADFGYQLDRNACLRIDVLQVVNQLRQILDGIDVVMRRRRNQADARRSSAAAAQSLRPLCGPGSCPPSPGLAPWAILICNSSALTR